MRAPLTLLAMILAVLLPATLVSAAPDETMTLNKGESGSYSSGSVPGGANPLYFEQAPGVGGDESCSKSATAYCETVLVELVNPVEDDGDPLTNETARRNFSVNLSTAAADYDMIVYNSDAEGAKGTEFGRSTAFPTGDTSESVFGSVTTSEEQDRHYLLVEVIFFAPATPMTLDLRF